MLTKSSLAHLRFLHLKNSVFVRDLGVYERENILNKLFFKNQITVAYGQIH